MCEIFVKIILYQDRTNEIYHVETNFSWRSGKHWILFFVQTRVRPNGLCNIELEKVLLENRRAILVTDQNIALFSIESVLLLIHGKNFFSSKSNWWYGRTYTMRFSPDLACYQSHFSKQCPPNGLGLSSKPFLLSLHYTTVPMKHYCQTTSYTRVIILTWTTPSTCRSVVTHRRFLGTGKFHPVWLAPGGGFLTGICVMIAENGCVGGWGWRVSKRVERSTSEDSCLLTFFVGKAPVFVVFFSSLSFWGLFL